MKNILLISIVAILFGIASNASAALKNKYLKVEKNDPNDCSSSFSWYQTTTSFTKNGNTWWYAPSNFPKNNIDGVRVKVTCDDCTLYQNNWYFQRPSDDVWDSSCDYEGHYSGEDYRMEERCEIQDFDYAYDLGPGCDYDGYVKLKWKYTSGGTQYRWYWGPYPTVC